MNLQRVVAFVPLFLLMFWYRHVLSCKKLSSINYYKKIVFIHEHNCFYIRLESFKCYYPLFLVITEETTCINSEKAGDGTTPVSGEM